MNLLTVLNQMNVKDLELVATLIKGIIAEKNKETLIDDLRKAWYAIEDEGYFISWGDCVIDVNELEINEKENDIDD